MELSSNSLQPGKTVPEKYVYNGFGCHGDNLSPHLEWRGAPSETKSFAITVFDPDAPTDHGWWHWAVVNIPDNVNYLAEGASNRGDLPRNAVELVNDFHNKRYGGPCPPKKDAAHRYEFTVYALETDQLKLDSGTTAQELKDILEESCLDKSSFNVKYGRH